MNLHGGFLASNKKPRAAAKRAAPTRKNDPEGTKRNILAIATREFAKAGYNGARIDALAAKTAVTKRMIYYYFGGKEQLYIAVLEQEYGRIREAEASLQLDDLDPEAAIRRLTEFTFDYHHANPDFVRLVTIENIHHARHLNKSKTIREVNATIVRTIDGILKRGRKAGVFQSRIRAVDVHLLMSAMCFYQVSNLYTFGTIFEPELSSPTTRRTHRRLVANFIAHELKQP
jgi:AcrR family transcriptional regulator